MSQEIDPYNKLYLPTPTPLTKPLQVIYGQERPWHSTSNQPRMLG